MSAPQIALIVSMALVAVVTFYLGRRSTVSQGSQDFGVARRTVRSARNAAAMSGEYLCVALFLGIAGAVLTEGAEAIWYPVGFTAGFLALMIFVAAPLRRSGAYTIPDFVQGRLGSSRVRWLASVFVVLIVLLYLVPQLHGAELTFTTLLGLPDWAGPVAVTVVVLVSVLGGGMRSITVTQAFQYWLKLFAITAPTLVLCALFVGLGAGSGAVGLSTDAPPKFTEPTTVEIRTPVTLQVREPTTLRATGTVNGGAADGTVKWSSEVDHEVAAGTTLEFDEGSSAPVVIGGSADNANWLTPGDGGTWQLLGTYSLIIALLLGAMGLPHILMRFYTNPDGKAARRTTLHVLLFVGLFAVFPTLLGALSRLYVPELLVTGETDAAVLLLPTRVLPGVGGEILTTVIVAGVFSAFLAASSGLVFGVAGVVSADLLPERIRDFRLAAVLVALVALGLALLQPRADLAESIAMAFAMAASTFCPVLVLGIWWRGLTSKGAAAGMLGGGGIVLAAIVIGIVSGRTGDWAPWIVDRPALLSVPVAFVLTVLVSNATRGSLPATVNAAMLRMHAPDTLGFVREQDTPRPGQTEQPAQADERKAGHGKHRR